MIKPSTYFLSLMALLLVAALPAYGAGSGAGAPHKEKGLYGFGTRQVENDPLMQAVESGDLAKVKKLIGEGTNVNVKMFNGFTPLHMAAYKDKSDITKLLIGVGANINAAMISGVTPLYLAAERGYDDVVEILVSKKAKIDFPSVAVAVSNDNLSTLKLFLAHGFPVTQSAGGATLLHVATFAGKTDMIEWLIEKGVDVNAVDDKGRSALDVAMGDDNITALLKKHGAKLQGGGDFDVLSQAAGNAMQMKDYELAKSRYVEALKALKPDHKAYKPLRLMTLYNLTYSYYLTSDIDNAGKTAKEFIKAYSDDSRVGKTNLAEMYEMVATSDLASRNFAGAEENIRNAIKYYQVERIKLDSASAASQSLGDLLMKETRMSEAQVAYTQAYEILKSSPNPDPLKLIDTQIHVGIALFLQKNRNDAKKVFLENMETIKHVLGDDDPELLKPMSWLLAVSTAQHDKKSSLKWCEKMLAFEGRPGTEQTPWARIHKMYKALKTSAADSAKKAD